MKKLTVLLIAIFAMFALTACANQQVIPSATPSATPSLDQTTSQEQAREIMGQNFFGIEEAIMHCGVSPSNQQIAALAEIPFMDDVLESHKDTHILIAVFPISILEITSGNSPILSSHVGKQHKNEKFIESKGTTGWQLVRKTPIEGSTDKTWDEQQALLGKDNEIPSARVMAYTIIGHYLATGEQLFIDVWARCSDLDSGGCHVAVGSSGGNWLFLFWDGGGPGGSSLGIASARKP